MQFVLFYHSLVSDWNHGNAHFLRGVASELLARGHAVRIYEPRDGWSRANLLRANGPLPLHEFQRVYPALHSDTYSDPQTIDLDAALDGADVVLVHEWNAPALVRRIGAHRVRHGGYRLFFHDTHHRAATRPDQMARYDLSGYDGVLAFGEVIRELYLQHGWAARAWTWHEAADTRVFCPPDDGQHATNTPPLEHAQIHAHANGASKNGTHPNSAQDAPKSGDLVWIGNWGDAERTGELLRYLFWPSRRLALKTRVYGVRYPRAARIGLRLAGIDYRGWLPNYRVPEVFARFRATVHVPRRPYVEKLPGIPTIRVFEALACGIPLVCSPWDDAEHLFTPGADFLMATDPADMLGKLRDMQHDPALRESLSRQGRATIERRHTCAHRVDELLTLCAELDHRPIRSHHPVDRLLPYV